VVARGRVLRAGRTPTACAGDVFAVSRGEERLVLAVLATATVVRDRPGPAD